MCFFFSSRRRHTRFDCDWSSDVCSSDLATNLAEFLAWAKQQKTGVSWGSAGLGSPHHLVGELFREQAGISNMTHVPYRGAAPAVQDVVGGQIPAMWADSATIIPFLSEKKLKAIGVASPARVDVLPQIATLQEQGLKGFEGYAWQGIVVPTGSSAEGVRSEERRVG